MKKLLLIAALITTCGVASAQYREGYYNPLDGKKSNALKTAAKGIVADHVRLDYTALPDYWVKSDIYPELYDGARRWWDMYSNEVYLIKANQTGRSSFSANKMQREHSVPKSWWKKNNDVEYTPAYSDMWNLYPSDGPANQAKSNYPMGVCTTTTFNNGCTKVGIAKSGYGGGAATVFEPADEYKGDFARTVFYMATVYDDLSWVNTWMFQNGSYPSLQSWAINMLLEWAANDPVSQKEVDRNNAVEVCQGNRNPYVDFPQLAEYVWGSKKNTAFYIKDQDDATGTPVEVTGKPEIVRPAMGEALDFGECAVGQTVVRQLEIYAQNLTQALSLRIVGDNRTQFSIDVSSVPAATINGTEVYRLDVYYRPTAEGAHTARLRLYDGGLALDDVVTVNLEGRGCAVPSLSTLTAYAATEITETSYTARWSEAPEVVDYYIVNRVRYASDGTYSSTLYADTNWLLIDDRESDVAESYTVQSSRLGYTSPVSNSVMVGAGTGISEVNAQPLIVGTTEGGIVILGESGQREVKVYDLDGRLILWLEETGSGEFIPLARGFYIIAAPGSQPVKAAVR